MTAPFSAPKGQHGDLIGLGRRSGRGTRAKILRAGELEGLRRTIFADRHVSFGSWPCKNTLPKEFYEKPGPVRSQVASAAISSLVLTMFMTRVRL
jgi:hypothetical protein